MDADRHASAGADVAPGTARGLLWRAALLAGHGAQARELAEVLVACTRDASSRTCLDAGARLQLTVDAPGPASLRVGLRLGEAIDRGAIAELLGEDEARRVVALHEHARASAIMPAAAAVWLFWRRGRHELVVPLDPARRDRALELADDVAREAGTGAGRGARTPARAPAAAAWALTFASGDDLPARVRVAWLIPREPARRELVLGDHWPVVRRTAARLLGGDLLGGRWLAIDPLCDGDAPALRIGTTAWSLVPEDVRKRDALGRACAELGGVQAWAESLWALCRATAGDRWRVGRALELRIRDDDVRARWFLTPCCR